MTPREQRFVKSLIEKGAASIEDAAHLETVQAGIQSEAGEYRPIWEVAVEQGVITPIQAEKFRKELDAPEAPPGAAPPGKRAERRFIGGYELISKIGQGGMGAVYKARQRNLAREVAIKVLPRHLAKDRQFIDRFTREARAAGRLSHPNVVTGIDVGYADGYHYFVMEYVEGSSLAERLTTRTLDEDEAVKYGRQMADALQHAHEMGIVHRDVKPENILVDRHDRAKLCDLGLARSESDDLQITQAGMAIGTPFYISPEQARGKDPDARSDVYSLGCTLYHLLGGRPPFDGENAMEILHKHLKETAPPLSEHRPGLSPDLEAVVARMMARAPEDRYQTAAEVLEDLDRVAAGEPTEALRMAGPRPASSRKPRPTGAGARRGGRTTTSVRRAGGTTAGIRVSGVHRRQRSSGMTVGLIAAALVAGAAVFVLVRGGGGPDYESERRAHVRALEKEFEGLRTLEEMDSGNYAMLIERYRDLVTRARGTEVESRAAAALNLVRKRQREDLSKERLARLAAKFKAAEQFALGNPKEFKAIVSRFEKLAESAGGTEYEHRALTAARATRERRASEAREALAASRAEVKQMLAG
ncbi:MAG: serine/threonine-protein kinase, partial [Planctomycetota bacterium]